MREKRRIQFFAKTKTFPNEIYEKENAKAPIFWASGLSYRILKIGEHQCMPAHFSQEASYGRLEVWAQLEL